MHPEVVEFVSKNKKNWKPWQIAMFEDLKQTFPNKSVEWGLWVLIKYLKPEIILTDVDRGVEVWMEMDVVKKIAPIVEKYGLGKPEQRTALAMTATKEAIKNEMREEMNARSIEIEKKLKKQIAQQLHIQPLKSGINGTPPLPRVLTWEERKACFKEAVLHVMMLKKKQDGSYLFYKNRHWIAVYRFTVDEGLMYKPDDPNEPKDPSTPQFKQFADFAHELMLDVNPPTRLPFARNSIKDLNKDNYARYNTEQPWSKDGLVEDTTNRILNAKGHTLFRELCTIYAQLDKAYELYYKKKATTQD